MMKLIGLVFLMFFVVVAYTEATGCVDMDEEFHGMVFKCADYAHKCTGNDYEKAAMAASCPKTCGLC